jgi:hypothetical protein
MTISTAEASEADRMRNAQAIVMLLTNRDAPDAGSWRSILPRT